MTVPRFAQYLLVFLTIGSATLLSQAQCTQKLAELPGAPELLGFRMGMTKEDIKLRVPQVVFGRTDPFGVSKTTINPYFDLSIDKTKFEAVRTISLDLMDDHLTSLWIGYDETYKVQDVNEFVKLVSLSLKVPTTWSTWKGRGQQIRCADFQLIVTTVARGPSLRVLDVGADELIAARRQAKEEQDSGAESGSEEAAVQITGDKQAKVYYLATCQPPKEISEGNKIAFKSTEEAEKAGFKLARGCH